MSLYACTIDSYVPVLLWGFAAECEHALLLFSLILLLFIPCIDQNLNQTNVTGDHENYCGHSKLNILSLNCGSTYVYTYVTCKIDFYSKPYYLQLANTYTGKPSV